MKIEAKPLTDADTIVKHLTRDPRLLDSMADDFPIIPEHVAAVAEADMPMIKVLGVYVDDELVSIWMLHQLTSVMWQVHVAYDPEHWGTGLPKQTGKIALDAAFELTGGSKIYAFIPCKATPVVGFAKYCGMKIEGTCKRAWKKHGEVSDAYHMGVYR